MSNSDYKKFLDILITETKAKKFKWDYLDKNENLVRNMGWYSTPLFPTMSIEKKCPVFNTDDSFYAKSGNTYIVIYVHDNDPASLYVIPYTFKKTVHLSADEYGHLITRLHNIVQSQFPSADQFIKDFIFDEVEEI